MAEDRYYDGRTATAHRPTIAIDGDDLLINSADVAELSRWPLNDIRVIDVNKVTGGMNLGRLSDPAPRLLLHDSPERQTLLAAQPALVTWQRREAKRGFTVGATWTVIGLAIAASAFFGWRHGAAALAQFVPKTWEQRLGEKIHTAVTDNFATCSDPEGLAALRTMADKLLPDGLDVTLDVIDLKLPNAAAIPGDHVFITSGLIELADSPDMVAGVLAHEIAHLELRHPTQGVISNLGIAATVSLILGGSGAGDIAYLATSMSYSRDMETEADIRGLELLQKAGLKADGLAAFFKVMAEREEEKGGGLMPDWLSSHPGLEDRATYTASDSGGASALTDAEWQKLKQVCSSK